MVLELQEARRYEENSSKKKKHDQLILVFANHNEKLEKSSRFLFPFWPTLTKGT